MRVNLENVEITDEQAILVKKWIEANKSVPGWLDSYALGDSYIDTRANGGRGIGKRREYVKLDHEVAKRVPQLRGVSPHDIKEFMRERDLKIEEVNAPRM